jgi:hypothetical protein
MKIFFEPIPGMETFICLGITKQFCTESYQVLIKNFITELTRKLKEFFIYRFNESDRLNKIGDYNYLITRTIIDKVYHKHFPNLRCLLGPKEKPKNYFYY